MRKTLFLSSLSDVILQIAYFYMLCGILESSVSEHAKLICIYIYTYNQPTRHDIVISSDSTDRFAGNLHELPYFIGKKRKNNAPCVSSGLLNQSIVVIYFTHIYIYISVYISIVVIIYMYVCMYIYIYMCIYISPVHPEFFLSSAIILHQFLGQGRYDQWTFFWGPNNHKSQACLATRLLTDASGSCRWVSFDKSCT